ncbi:MAG TPA: addiction module protein [Thiobacillaceae bacterium]|nr:addiction module protein [Thiobacillaceae bacterium]HNU63895.1 addiction module protein [Thiobacillaceae bacterium]
MTAELKDLAAQAMQLTPEERSQLAHQLILSLHEASDDSPEAIARAWEEEIARRIADMDAGVTQWIPGEEVIAKMRAKIKAAQAHADQRQR